MLCVCGSVKLVFDDSQLVELVQRNSIKCNALGITGACAQVHYNAQLCTCD
jgi:hypothetical protein